MTKEELLKKLKILCDEEERAVSLYMRHLESTLFLSGFETKKQKEVRKMLLVLAVESGAHKKMFESAMQLVKDSERNVY